jgi:hypothetical protein
MRETMTRTETRTMESGEYCFCVNVQLTLETVRRSFDNEKSVHTLLEEAGRGPRTLGSMEASSDYYYAETIYKMYSRDYNGSLHYIMPRGISGCDKEQGCIH